MDAAHSPQASTRLPPHRRRHRYDPCIPRVVRPSTYFAWNGKVKLLHAEQAHSNMRDAGDLAHKLDTSAQAHHKTRTRGGYFLPKICPSHCWVAFLSMCKTERTKLKSREKIEVSRPFCGDKAQSSEETPPHADDYDRWALSSHAKHQNGETFDDYFIFALKRFSHDRTDQRRLFCTPGAQKGADTRRPFANIAAPRTCASRPPPHWKRNC